MSRISLPAIDTFHVMGISYNFNIIVNNICIFGNYTKPSFPPKKPEYFFRIQWSICLFVNQSVAFKSENNRWYTDRGVGIDNISLKAKQ